MHQLEAALPYLLLNPTKVMELLHKSFFLLVRQTPKARGWWFGCYRWVRSCVMLNGWARAEAEIVYRKTSNWMKCYQRSRLIPQSSPSHRIEPKKGFSVMEGIFPFRCLIFIIRNRWVICEDDASFDVLDWSFSHRSRRNPQSSSPNPQHCSEKRFHGCHLHIINYGSCFASSVRLCIAAELTRAHLLTFFRCAARNQFQLRDKFTYVSPSYLIN